MDGLDLETRGIYPVELEYRQAANRIEGRFPYGSTATTATRGRRRKERFEPRAFEYAINEPSREIHLLVGHAYGQPLASKQRGTLLISDSAEAVEFAAILPPETRRPTWMIDTILAIEDGLVGGISPGFNVPPRSAVRNAEIEIPEPGNPGVTVRSIRAAVLFEMSTVTRPSYSGPLRSTYGAGSCRTMTAWRSRLLPT